MPLRFLQRGIPSASRRAPIARRTRCAIHTVIGASILVANSSSGSLSATHAQSSTNPCPPACTQPITHTSTAVPSVYGAAPALTPKAINAINARRKRELASDLATLQQLAALIHQQLLQAPVYRPTDEDLLRLARIEKLAQHVQKEMKQSWRSMD